VNDPWAYLKGCFERGRLAHAYLLEGSPSGAAGEMAMNLAKLLMCKGAGSKPCGTCEGCRRVQEKNHPDVIRVEPESKSRRILVEQVSSMLGFIQLKSFEGGWKVCILAWAERMNDESANKFLKTLEEPPPQTLLLLLTDLPDAMLNTTRSRCQRIPLGGLGVSLESMGEWGRLVMGILREGFPVDEMQVLASTAAFAGVFDGAKKEITRRVASELKAGDEELGKDVIEARSATEARGLWRDLCRLIQLWYRDLVVLQSGGGEHLLHFRDEVETLRAQLAAPGVTPGRLRRVTAGMDDVAEKLDRNLPPLTAFESGLSRFV